MLYIALAGLPEGFVPVEVFLSCLALRIVAAARPDRAAERLLGVAFGLAQPLQNDGRDNGFSVLQSGYKREGTQ